MTGERREKRHFDVEEEEDRMRKKLLLRKNGVWLEQSLVICEYIFTRGSVGRMGQRLMEEVSCVCIFVVVD